MLSDAWESLTETNLQGTWRKLWPYEEKDDKEEEGDIDGPVNEIREIFSTISGSKQSEKKNAIEWLAVDSTDPGYQILTE